MSEFSTGTFNSSAETESMPARVYFKDDPELGIPADVETFEEALYDRFGLYVCQETWGTELVYSLDCLPRDLETVAELVEQAGFWKLLESHSRTYISSDDITFEGLSLP